MAAFAVSLRHGLMGMAFEKRGVVRGMDRMAVGAGADNRIIGMGLFKLAIADAVTSCAEVLFFLLQQNGSGRSVCAVAGAAAVCHRLMDEITCEECFVVAGKAQILFGCFQQIGMGAVMVLVALLTIALLNRRMQGSGPCQILGEFLMAAEAHFSSFDMKKCASDQSMPPVTAGAVAARHRLVHHPLVVLIAVLLVTVKTGFTVT